MWDRKSDPLGQLCINTETEREREREGETEQDQLVNRVLFCFVPFCLLLFNHFVSG